MKCVAAIAKIVARTEEALIPTTVLVIAVVLPVDMEFLPMVTAHATAALWMQATCAKTAKSWTPFVSVTARTIVKMMVS